MSEEQTHDIVPHGSMKTHANIGRPKAETGKKGSEPAGLIVPVWGKVSSKPYVATLLSVYDGIYNSWVSRCNVRSNPRSRACTALCTRAYPQ